MTKLLILISIHLFAIVCAVAEGMVWLERTAQAVVMPAHLEATGHGREPRSSRARP